MYLLNLLKIRSLAFLVCTLYSQPLPRYTVRHSFARLPAGRVMIGYFHRMGKPHTELNP